MKKITFLALVVAILAGTVQGAPADFKKSKFFQGKMAARPKKPGPHLVAWTGTGKGKFNPSEKFRKKK